MVAGHLYGHQTVLFGNLIIQTKGKGLTKKEQGRRLFCYLLLLNLQQNPSPLLHLSWTRSSTDFSQQQFRFFSSDQRLISPQVLQECWRLLSSAVNWTESSTVQQIFRSLKLHVRCGVFGKIQSTDNALCSIHE